MENVIEKSVAYLQEAQQYIPGGVNSPVRAFRSVGGNPLFIAKAKGSKVYDVDGNEYIDYVGSWGPMILGHSHPEVIEAVKQACENGTSFGAPTELEIKMAKLVTELVPSIEMVRMVNSGTEATMSAIRLARGFTGLDKIIKFEGGYHGHGDSFLIQAGSGAMTLGVPNSPGVTESIAKDTLLATFNDLESVRELVDAYPRQIASIIVEPVMGNMGCIPPRSNFLKDLRALCDQNNILLIFDEVMTGFRVALGGAQEHYDVQPDITTLGKIIGGGLPVGAFGGKKEIMEHLAPTGPVYQAGTLSGNPLAMAAGYATLSLIKQDSFYDELQKKAQVFQEGVMDTILSFNIPATFNSVGSMHSLFFTDQPVIDHKSAQTGNTEKFKQYFHEMLNRGIYLAPSPYEAGFLSIAHSDDDLNYTLEYQRKVLKKLFKR